MQESTEFIISAVVLIAAAGLLAFGFGSLTGYSTQEISSTTVDVSPSVVSPGEYININVDAQGKRGVNNRFSICKNTLCFSSGWLHCTGYGCRKKISASYRIPSNLVAGEYFVKIIDLSTGDVVKGNFEVE